MIIAQQPAESLSAVDFAGRLADFGARLDQLVLQPLMISLGMVMLDESLVPTLRVGIRSSTLRVLGATTRSAAKPTR